MLLTNKVSSHGIFSELRSDLYSDSLQQLPGCRAAFSYTHCTYRIHIIVLILFLLLEERVTRTIKWNALSMPPCLARVELLTTLFFPYPINHHHAVLPSCCHVAHSARSPGNKTCLVAKFHALFAHFKFALAHALLHPFTHFCTCPHAFVTLTRTWKDEDWEKECNVWFDAHFTVSTHF